MLIVETGRVTLECKDSKFDLRKGECAVLPLRVCTCRLTHARTRGCFGLRWTARWRRNSWRR